VRAPVSTVLLSEFQRVDQERPAAVVVAAAVAVLQGVVVIHYPLEGALS